MAVPYFYDDHLVARCQAVEGWFECTKSQLIVFIGLSKPYYVIFTLYFLPGVPISSIKGRSLTWDASL